MPQIRVTNKTKVLLDHELALHKGYARQNAEPLPSMAYITEAVILEGLASLEKARKRQERKNETNKQTA